MRLGKYRWPRKVGAWSVVLNLVWGAGMIVVGYESDQQGPMCGSVPMRPGDRCVTNGSGSGASYSDVANAPGSGLLVAGGVVVLIVLLVRLCRPRKLTGLDIARFEDYVHSRRIELRKQYRTSPRLQRKADSREELLARFDRWAARQRKRKGFDDSRRLT